MARAPRRTDCLRGIAVASAISLIAACGGRADNKGRSSSTKTVAAPDGGTRDQSATNPAPWDPVGPAPQPDAGVSPDFDYAASLTADFADRDALPQTNVLESDWFATSAWGPPAATYPPIAAPAEVSDALQWKRDRVIEVAKHFLGLPYAHFHIPAAGGLDCSNFTAWVYNYGFGIRFTSNVVPQALEAGRLLLPGEPLQKGDLLYIQDASFTGIVHVVIYVDETHIIDDTSSATPDGVAVREFTGWYKSRFSHARRILE